MCVCVCAFVLACVSTFELEVMKHGFFFFLPSLPLRGGREGEEGDVLVESTNVDACVRSFVHACE